MLIFKKKKANKTTVPNFSTNITNLQDVISGFNSSQVLHFFNATHSKMLCVYCFIH